jgi:eukaryotic-like serine/threonine-protein kinase
MANKIGRFEINSELSKGEVSSVYKATDSNGGRTVALKAIQLESLGDQAPALVKTALEESAACRVLASHNIAILNDAEQVDGFLCASMEYVQGNSIATMLARKEGFSIWDLQDIARQSCQGLDHAHVRKVCHYSLEPAKIMVQWDGIVKILGFGISSTGARAIHASGKPPLTLHYMSPEQVRGDAVDARSNLFTLGAILYEMVTERKAFDGEDAEQVRQQILEATPVPVGQINRKVHPALEAVIHKALAKTPEERYQSGQELVTDLEKCKESAAKAAPKVAPAAAPASKPAPVSAVAPLSRAAAAGQGAGGAAATSKPAFTQAHVLKPESAPAANLSAAATEEPSVETRKIPVDPMMSESGQSSGGRQSFSEINELPPLKEVYVAPAPPPEPKPEPVDDVKAAVFNRTAPAKPKTPPSKVAKKAVSEITKTPPHMFVYAIAAAAVIILLVVAGIAYHIHSGDEDDNSVPETAATQDAPAPAPAASATQTPTPQPPTPPVQQAEQPSPAPAPQAAVPENPPAEAVPEPPVEKAPAAAITSKSKEKRSKAKGKPVRPASPSIVYGQLNVESAPAGAQISIDGQMATGVTPVNVANLMPGHHTITISKFGFASETRAIDVSSGSKSAVSVQLSPTTASVAANSNPTGAAIWIDGKNSGKVTPAQLTLDKPGTHSLVFKKQGYLDETATVNGQIGQTVQVSPTLRALGETDEIKIGGKFRKVFGGSETAGMGTVSVKTEPKGAQIAVNSRIIDKMSPVEFYLNPGNYVIDITLSGFQTVEKVVTVEKNGKVVIDESLNRE